MSTLIKGLLHSKLGLLIIAGAVIALFLVAGLPRTVYHQGWEVKNDLVALDHADEVTPAQWPSVWRIDLDEPAYGLPDLELSISDVRVKEGVWPYADLEQVFDDYKYFVTYKEYLFDVQIRTVADTHLYASGWADGNRWEHETACPYSWHSIGGTWDEGRIGQAFTGSVFVRFAIHPWGQFDFGTAPDGYRFTDYWAGVMNAKMEEKDMGKVETGANFANMENHQGWVKGLPSDGSQLNMMQDDGTYAQAYASVPWDVNKVLDPDIHSVIILEFPFEIMAGAYEDYGGLEYMGTGAINNLYPVDYYFTATIRIESFIVKELTADARDPIVPPNPSPITPPVDYYPVHVPTWLEQNWIWLIVGVLVVLILFAVFVGPWIGIGLGWLLGVFRYYTPSYVHGRGDNG